MVRRAHVWGPTFLFVALLCPARAQAEPITTASAAPTAGNLSITAGELLIVHADAFASMTMAVSGTGFSLFLRSGDQFSAPAANRVTPSGNIAPSFSASGALDPIGTFLQLGESRVPLRNGADDSLTHWLVLKVTGPLQRLPVVADPDAGFILTFPFLATGSFAITSEDGTEFRFGFSGVGTGSTMFWGPFEDGRLKRIESRLTFAAAAPTPEPSSLLLVATAAGICAIRARRRERA